MGGVFTVVSLAAIGLLAGIVMFLRKRQLRRAADDEAYFEKYEDHNASADDLGDVGGGYGNVEPVVTDVMAPAAADAYPDREVHYGPTDAQPYGPAVIQPYENTHDATYAPQEYGIEYPPGTAYTSAVAQDGQYEYNGPENSQYTPHYEEGAPQQPMSANHPYSNSSLAARPGGAPPVRLESGYSVDSYYVAEGN